MINDKINDSKVYNFHLDTKFPNDFDYFTLLKTIYDAFKLKKTSSNLTQALLDLRRLLKYQQGFFFPCFDNLFDYFAVILSSENHHITKEALVLIQELFSIEYKYDKYEEWLGILIPKLITISLLEDNDPEVIAIKTLSNNCLQNCSIHMLDKGLVDILVDQLDTCDDKIGLKVFQLIIELVNRNNKIIIKDGIDWDNLFSKALEMRLKKNNSVGIELIKFIKTIVSKNKWKDIISAIDQRIINDIISHLQCKEFNDWLTYNYIANR